MSQPDNHGSGEYKVETFSKEGDALRIADLVGDHDDVSTADQTETQIVQDKPATFHQAPTNNAPGKSPSIAAGDGFQSPEIQDEEAARTAGKLGNLHLSVEPPRSITPTESKDLPPTPPAPLPPSETEKPYLDPTPRTPTLSRQPSGEPPSLAKFDEKDAQYEEDQGMAHMQNNRQPIESDRESASEIQSIMDQFADEAGAPTREEIMSPRHELSSPMLGVAGQFPPRKSSLEPLRSRELDAIASSPVTATSEKLPASPPPVPPKPELEYQQSSPHYALKSGSTTSLHSVPPPPEPEPDLPFDFHRFLEQLRHKSADPVAKFLRSFLTEFGKKQWMVHEQVKIIGDFLTFISNKMALCDVWRGVSDAEFDNAKEGMEKLVMNRLYGQTFSPAIPPSAQPPRVRGKRREPDRILGPGRRGQHQEDVERDDILAQKIRIYSWVREEHLDILPVGPNGERFLKLAQQELLKIKGYRAPRDKVICVLNCCKVIFGLLKNAKSSDTSADSFIPLLIYVVLQANPEHLVSNIQYILRFRNQDKLGGEAGYYLSSLSGAIQFIESLDRTTLTVSDDEFERNVELAVSAIAAQYKEAELASPTKQQFSEKSSLAEPELTPRNSMDITSTSPGKNTRAGRSTEGFSSDSGAEEAVTGLLRTIQRPLSAIGRMLSDPDSRPESRSGHSGGPQSLNAPGPNPSVYQPLPPGTDEGRSQSRPRTVVGDGKPRSSVQSYDAQEAAARQASAEAAQARQIQRAEHRNVVETLYGMFPNLDKEVIDDVVRQKQGRVGLAVDACLALTSTG